MSITKGLLVAAGITLLATPSSACALLDIFKGDLELATVKLATVKNQLSGSPDYETFLLRNAARNTDGILYNAIRAELVPGRNWFDVNDVAAKRIGLLSDGTVDDVTEAPSCKDVKVTYKVVKGAIVFSNGGKPLGRITGKVPKGMF